jgi:RNA polymerase sigma-70 factor (ECF subfamily)
MDHKYLQKVLDGDTNAFRFFVDRYKDMAFSLAMSLARDKQTAEEIVQDAFLKAFKNIKKFQKRSKFSTWFYKIVLNEARSRLRKKKIPTWSLNTENLDETHISDVNHAVSNLRLEDQKKHINHALGKLSPKESLLLRLFYLDEKDVKEIQEITGLTKSNIKTILFRSRKSFYSILSEQLREEVTTLL